MKKITLISLILFSLILGSIYLIGTLENPKNIVKNSDTATSKTLA